MMHAISGDTQLLRLLRNFPDRIQRNIINSVAGRGATVVKKHAKKNIRQNGSVETGQLLNSLKSKKKKGVHGEQWIYTKDTAWYAHLVEFGTAPRRLARPIPFEIEPGKWITLSYTGQMPAKPFMRPAVEENQREILREMAIRAAKRMAKEAEKMSADYRTLSRNYRRMLVR